MRSIYKYYFLITALLICGTASAQVKSLTAYGDYSFALSDRLGVTGADAVGGGVDLTFTLGDNLSLSVTGGYRLYSVSQENQLEGWQWRFWNERYYDKIESDLRADPNLDVTISSVQKMDLIPAALTLNYEIPLNERISIIPSAGGGIYFYTRRMFVVEEWSKYFPQEEYSFDYSYRNFAPDKKGNPVFITGGLDLRYDLSAYALLTAGAQYNRVVPTEGNMGYDSFIFEDELKLKLGLTFIY